MVALPFLKMHGLGNDFVVIDLRDRPVSLTLPQRRWIADRRRGIGCDQLILLESPRQRIADVFMRIHNPDGGEAGACGNATRCVAQRVMDERGSHGLIIRTARGLLVAERRDGRVWVNMGAPQRDWAEVPLARAVDPLHLPLPGDPAAVGMGNPHAVHFVADLPDPAVAGPAVETHPLFPERTNVEFAAPLGAAAFRVRVWERGTGVTLACGSGACAVAVAAHLRGMAPRRVDLVMDGGTLVADWRDDGVWLTGPVAHVFDGVVTPEALR